MNGVVGMAGQTPGHASLVERLDLALVALRRATVADGSLWLGLLDRLSLDEGALASLLFEAHGVAVIGDDAWPTINLNEALNIEPNATRPASTLRLMVGGRAMLLSEDPWSPASTLALSRSTTPAQLALAKPGQWRQLPQALPRGQATSNAAVPEVGAPGISGAVSPVVQFVDGAITRAYREGASDIHFETGRTGMGVKYRLDGVMATGERLDDPRRAEEVISRIKVMAQLDITERRRPQDGRIHWSRAGHDTIDLRVSIMPSIFGEDAVLRLLDKAQLRHAEREMSLDLLGFDEGAASLIRSLAARPHGMLLVTGPTGSGKTTTVYAALSEVNDGLEKIITIEDPVEYELPGVLQIPVNEQKGLTFATGLRSILRHDPDKILVGEIRDSETAEIAVQSALTGHLVFTTVHANSLFDVLGRFQHFAIDPFALASALNGVVVQRLLRRLCTRCSGSRIAGLPESNRLAELGYTVSEKLPQARGCDHCRHTGYRGRFVVAEVHELNDTVRDLIVRRSSTSELRSVLYREPSQRLLSKALAQVAQGATTIEEVTRVVGLA